MTFLSNLDVRVVDDSLPHPTYELLAPFGFGSRHAGEVWVPAGFVTDFASVPILAMAFLGQPGDRAAVVHDWLIRSNQVAREKADRAFLEALRCCGVQESVAQTMFYAVSGYTASLNPDPQIPWESRV